MNIQPTEARAVFGPSNLDLDAPTAGDLVADEAERRRLAGDPPIATCIFVDGWPSPDFVLCGSCGIRQLVGDGHREPIVAFCCDDCGTWNTMPVYMNALHGGQVEIIPPERRNEFPALRELEVPQ